MFMNNIKIRTKLSDYRFYQWELAEWLGVSQTTLARRMRVELPDDIQEKILNVIECEKNSIPYDNSFFREYIRQFDKRFGGRKRTAECYARFIEKGLDEAEKRRMEGGWDLSL
jgi:hypothetical protein